MARQRNRPPRAPDPRARDSHAIDRAYRLQISQHHPDKVATLGEDIRRLAEARTKEINAAYEVAVRQAR